MPDDLVPPSQIKFLLNGKSTVARNSLPSTTLLDYVRSEGLTGAKEGCAEGECGACTVLMVCSHGNGSRFVPINSCLFLLPMAAGQEFYTVEALAEGGRLAEVQQAMIATGGSQCGYCTPGFVVALFAEQYRPGRSGSCDPHAMGGNLCRCTGYRPIRDAALALGPAPAGLFLDRLQQPAPVLQAVDTKSFHRPTSLSACLRILAENPAARLIAGGTDLVVENNLRDRRFPVLVSVEALPELRVFSNGPDAVTLGAGLTLSEIGERWLDAPPVVADWLRLFASVLIRNRATLGGNLGTASPIGDSAPLLLALDASVQIAGTVGQRTVPLHEFFQGYRQTSLHAGEVLVSVTIPKPFPAAIRFYKVAKRQSDDISTVAAAFGITTDASGLVTWARFAFGGVAATPLRVVEAENAAIGRVWDEELTAHLQQLIAQTLRPLSDHRGSAAYRLAMAQSLIAKYCYENALEAAA